MLIGYVSDEYFSAMVDVAIEFRRGDACVALVRSSPRGAIYADTPAGRYHVTLAKDGFGAKTVETEIDPHRPQHFRLLSDTMYGYVWPKWVRGGESGQFRVHSVEPYHLSLWRYGVHKQRVRPIGWFDEHGPRASTQILPDGDFTQTGVQWNHRGYPANAQMVAAPQRSGLYYFHAETESGAFISFPWVVAPTQPQARIAVIASTNTWNAYNNFGGRSNYINPTGLPDSPTLNARLELSRYTQREITIWHPPDEQYLPLSFDRPEPMNHVPKDTYVTDPIRGRQACHLAPAEWRVLGWLEREGFEYDLYADAQLHQGLLDLGAYDVLIISTHPEYWSRDAYMKVKEWVFARGGKLMYLGGNGIDCEVELTGDTMRCRTHLPAPAGVPFTDDTGKRCDCRFHRTVESPAELLGVVFTAAGANTGAGFEVLDPSHWCLAGTNLRPGDHFGTTSLHERCPGGASGHETDERTASSPANLQLIARGLNEHGGGAELVYHETPSGGAVFSVGSITWGTSLLVDDHCSRITRNVLERFMKRQ